MFSSTWRLSEERVEQLNLITFCISLSLFALLLQRFVPLPGGLPKDAGYFLTLLAEHRRLCTAMLHGVVAAACIALGAYHLIRARVDRPAIVFYCMAGAVSACQFYLSNNNTYTNDLGGHAAYVNYIRYSWHLPYGYRGGEDWHPPLYYYVAALFAEIGQWIGHIEPNTPPRFVSWLCYLAFNYYGLLTLRLANAPLWNYRAAALLLLLWPGGLHLASKFSNEPMFFALWAASFHYAVAWYGNGDARFLRRALLIGGVGIMVRLNIFILFSVIAVMILAGWRRGVFFPLRHLLCWRWAGTFLALGACLTLSLYRLAGPKLTLRSPDADAGLNAAFPFYHYLFVGYEESLLMPFVKWSTETGKQSFWDYVLKTVLFGEYPWPNPSFAALMYALLVFLACGTLLCWLAARRTEMRGMLPFFAGFLIPLAMLLIYVTKRNYLFSQDVRYIYPFIISFCALLARAPAPPPFRILLLGAGGMLALTGMAYFSLYTR